MVHSFPFRFRISSRCARLLITRPKRRLGLLLYRKSVLLLTRAGTGSKLPSKIQKKDLFRYSSLPKLNIILIFNRSGRTTISSKRTPSFVLIASKPTEEDLIFRLEQQFDLNQAISKVLLSARSVGKKEYRAVMGLRQVKLIAEKQTWQKFRKSWMMADFSTTTKRRSQSRLTRKLAGRPITPCSAQLWMTECA